MDSGLKAWKSRWLPNLQIPGRAWLAWLIECYAGGRSLFQTAAAQGQMHCSAGHGTIHCLADFGYMHNIWLYAQ